MERKQLRYILMCILVIFFIVSLFIGAMDLNLAGLFNGNSEMLHVLLYSRLPRTLSVILASGSLALAGLIMQKIASNKFVSPQTAITSDAIKLGTLLSLLLGLNRGQRMILSILVGFVFTLAFFTIIRKIKTYDPITIPILGIVIGSIINAFTSLIGLRYDLNQTLNALFNKGFTSIFQGDYEVLYLNLVVLIFAILFMKRFIIIATNQDYASSLGIHIKTIVNVGLLMVSILSATVSLTVGNIPFVGLLIPNLIAFIFDDSVEGLIGDTLLLSAVYMLACDLISRIVIYPYEIPITLISGIVGAFVFVAMILKEQRYE